jgi:hypothetical protein
MKGGDLTTDLAALGQKAATDSLSPTLTAALSQVTVLTDVVKNANTMIVNAQSTILADCTDKLATGVASAVDQATTAATAAANAVCDSRLANIGVINPDDIASGQPMDGQSMDDIGSGPPAGGGRSACKCQCKCNIKTRRRKRAKRSKSRVRRQRLSARR